MTDQGETFCKAEDVQYVLPQGSQAAEGQRLWFLVVWSLECPISTILVQDQDVKQLVDNPGVFETTKALAGHVVKIDAWCCFKVLSYLHQLVRYSLIEEWLANPDGGNGQGRSSHCPMMDEAATSRYLQRLVLHDRSRFHSSGLKGWQRVVASFVGDSRLRVSRTSRRD